MLLFLIWNVTYSKYNKTFGTVLKSTGIKLVVVVAPVIMAWTISIGGNMNSDMDLSLPAWPGPRRVSHPLYSL